ncbi:hypothetical protein [Mesomycoplasma hyopneumoniae]|uniref:hypothetical protein n=1 Tax=Mesomycoplasma hyopneumoniae TaxID=2099 RepID=UPI001C68D665|nr:hypothetical protein [Mesomycoplasma hyopneumoniae]
MDWVFEVEVQEYLSQKVENDGCFYQWKYRHHRHLVQKLYILDLCELMNFFQKLESFLLDYFHLW